MRKYFHEYTTYVGIDTETTNFKGAGSLDPRNGGLALVQLNINGEVSVHRYGPEVRKIISNLADDPNTIFIGHNLDFDLKFLANNQIFLSDVFDTKIASEVYYAGTTSPDDATRRVGAIKRITDSASEEEEFLFDDIEEYVKFKNLKSSRMSFSLQTCLLRELNVFVKKDVQNSDWANENLSEEQLNYARTDVLYLIELAKKLWFKSMKDNLADVLVMEMSHVPVTASLNWIGVKIDKNRWLKHYENVKADYEKSKQELEEKISNHLNEQSSSTQFGLFEDRPKVKVNLNSSAEMPKILGLPNVQANTLKANTNKPFVNEVIKYKKLQKDTSTYGDGYLKRLSPENRLRTDFTQTFTSTGRLSSRQPNLQNVPPWFKQMVIADNGYIPVVADFSQVELRILAYLSSDAEFIKSTNSTDMHSANARLIWNIPEDQPVDPELRKKAKTVSFAVPYGSSGMGLVERGFFATVEEANEVINNFYKTFPDVAAFLQANATAAAQNGKNNDNSIGRIRRYELPRKPKNYDENFAAIKHYKYSLREIGVIPNDLANYKDFEEFQEKDKEGFEKALRILENKKIFDYFRECMSYERQLSGVRREGQNFPIQSTSASITKRALIDLYNYFKETGYGYVTLTIHDSIFFEINEKYFHIAYPKIKEIMEISGRKIVKDIVTPVDIEVGVQNKIKCKNCDQEKLMYDMYVDENYRPHKITEVECDC